MKKIFFSPLFILVNYCFGQSNTDTIFFKKYEDSSGYQVVFIDKPNSVYHKNIFRSLVYNEVDFNEKLTRLSSIYKVRKQGVLLNNLGEWISVYEYKKQKFAYSPSEPYYNILITITDSIISLNDFNDGFIPLAIQKSAKKNHQISYTLIGIDKKIIQLKFVQLSNQMAEIESSIFGKKKLRLIKKAAFFNLPIIVNYCPGSRCAEFDF